jgi:enterochelin esterase-like enzyme
VVAVAVKICAWEAATTAKWWWAGVLVQPLLVAFFIAWHCSREHGTVETVEHDASTGGRRKMIVYLPPGYSKEGRYPVLYLLHGAGDDETAWQDKGWAAVTLDRLHRERKLVPMIVVMPNAQGRGSAFEHDLIQEVIPYIESHYAARTDGVSRGIAGVSMGGGQALVIGLKHSDRFAWVGAFSPSLFGKSPQDVLDETRAGLSLLWISCGAADDQVLDLSKDLHEALAEQGIPHIWHISAGGHEWRLWRQDLYQFAQLLFRNGPPARGAP